jgi:serine/threonine-protein kinase HipA
MKKAKIFVSGVIAGVLEENEQGKHYNFRYKNHYEGAPVSLTMPLSIRHYEFDEFPPFFDGLLPEGMQLEALLKGKKLDADDFFEQLICVGNDLIGDVTVKVL